MKLDTIVEGVPLDIKTTIGNNWMVPPEAVGEHLFLVKTNVEGRLFSAGLFHAVPEHLNKGVNRDGKATINKNGKRAIEWIYEAVDF